MQKKMINCFTNSAGALLLALALVGFVTNLAGSRFVRLNDPIFAISMRSFFWIFGAVALVAGMVCLFGRRELLKSVLILWLAVSGFVYQIACIRIRNSSDLSAYLSGPAQTFGISSNSTDMILKAAFFFFLAGSAGSLLWLWLRGNKSMPMTFVHRDVGTLN